MEPGCFEAAGTSECRSREAKNGKGYGMRMVKGLKPVQIDQPMLRDE